MTILLNGKTALVRIRWTHDSSSDDNTAKWENCSSKNSLNESSSHDNTATVLVENCRTLGVKSTEAEEVESQVFFFLGNPAAKRYNL